MYGVKYSYEMTVNASGEFDMLVLGAFKCYSKSNAGAAGIFLTFATDGTVTIYHTPSSSTDTTHKSWGEFSGESTFEPGEDNTVTLSLTRVDADDLVLSLEINGNKVTFTGSDEDGVFTLENGDFRSNGYLTNNGMGQRAGFYPSSGSTLTVSSLEVTSTPAEA